ncbi:MAG: peptide chain release factor N(5)-glutamine methyltransferase [Actinomycetota bacterium]|nr:peptide chain release factor N(5)-glutamine methyltransferase [Actinomycetota bacterium]
MLARVEETLRNSGAESPAVEAWWILEAATKRNRAALMLEPLVTSEEERCCELLAGRRAAGEPLQYVTEVAGFRRLQIGVGPGVFIPRPETELVAERAMDRLPEGGRLVDVGTGSGAIALAIADERPDATVFGTESAAPAFTWAQRNRDRLGAPVELVRCDLLDGLPPALRGSFDVVVANPPYIDRKQAEALAPEIVDHEPHQALFAAERGLDVVIRLADSALAWLKPQGWLVLEIGSDQTQRVRTLLGAAGYDHVAVMPDLAGNDRIAEAQRP